MSDLDLAWEHCTEPPKVVCLCGSTRFMDEFFRTGWKETLRGRIVLSVGVVVDGKGPHQGEQHGVKDQLDELHFRKIDLADHILVLNVDGYVGASTQREIAYAMATDKPNTARRPARPTNTVYHILRSSGAKASARSILTTIPHPTLGEMGICR